MSYSHGGQVLAWYLGSSHHCCRGRHVQASLPKVHKGIVTSVFRLDQAIINFLSKENTRSELEGPDKPLFFLPSPKHWAWQLAPSLILAGAATNRLSELGECLASTHGSVFWEMRTVVAPNLWSMMRIHCCCLVTKSSLTLVTPRTVAHQAPLSIGFPRQEYWSGLPFLSPGDCPNPGIKPVSPALAGIFFTAEPPRKSHGKDYMCSFQESIWTVVGFNNQEPLSSSLSQVGKAPGSLKFYYFIAISDNIQMPPRVYIDGRNQNAERDRGYFCW